MAGALLLLPVMDALAKLLATRLPVVEIAWARFTIYALLVVPWAWHRHGIGLFRRRDLGLQLFRGALLALSAGLFFVGIARMPLADAMTVFFAYPLILLCLSTGFSAERPTLRTWSMAICGFIGVLLVVRPSFEGVAPGTPFALGAACLYATGLLVTRRLAGSAEPIRTTALSALVGAIGYSIAVPRHIVLPSPSDQLLLLLLGSIACVGHFGIVLAHRYATAAALAPIGYTEILSATCLSIGMFHALPSLLSWIGMTLVVLSGIIGSWPHQPQPAR